MCDITYASVHAYTVRAVRSTACRPRNQSHTQSKYHIQKISGKKNSTKLNRKQYLLQKKKNNKNKNYNKKNIMISIHNSHLFNGH